MAEAEQSNAFIRGATFPGSPASPGKTARFDRAQRKLFLVTGVNLFAKPFHVVQLAGDRHFRVFADDDARKIRNIGPKRMNVSMPFHENFNIQREQALQGREPFLAVNIVGSPGTELEFAL